MSDKAKLFGKLATVMSEVRNLAKTGRNAYDNYDYVTADAIGATIGAQLAANGIAFLPAVVESTTEEFSTQKGATNYHTTVHMQMVFACTETGETWISDWYGEGNDRSDKSINKAIVSAVKYFLLKTFLISGGDDVDADAESPERGRKTQPQRQQPKRPQTPQEARGGEIDESPPSDADDAPTGESNPFNAILDSTLKALHATGEDLYGDKWDEERVRLVEFVTAGAQQSSTELSEKEAQTLLRGMRKQIAKRDTESNGAKVAA